MSQASYDDAGGEWEIHLPTYGRRWATFAIVASSGAGCGFALSDGSLNLPIVCVTFFLAAVSGVSGL